MTEASAESPKPAANPREFRRYVWQRRWFQSLLAVLVVFLVLSYVLPGVLGLLYAVRSVLVPVLIGLALAYIVNPLLRVAAQRLKIGRLAGTISVMLMALVVFAVVMLTAVPVMISQGSSLIETVRDAYPRYVDKLLASMDSKADADEGAAGESAGGEDGDAKDDIPGLVPDDAPEPTAIENPEPQNPEAPEVSEQPGPAAADGNSRALTGESEGDTPVASAEPGTGAAPESGSETIAGNLKEEAASIVDKIIDPDRNRRLLEISVERLRNLDGSVIAGWAVQSLDIGVGLVGSAISFTSYLALSAVVVLFCFFFFSWKFDEILGWFRPFIPASSKDQTLDMLAKMDMAVSSFVRGRLIQSLVMMVVLVIGFWLAEVPYWFLLGVATGLMNLVPFLPAVGWIVALILTVMTTLANGGNFELGLILWPSVAYLVAQGLDGWLVEPLVQGKATNLDPLSVMLVVLIGGTLLGLLGMLLAIPLAACIKILARELVLPKLRGMAGEA